MTIDQRQNGSSQPSIAVAINEGTNKEHTELNRLITTRLKLALPPYTKFPSRYAIGLNYFAEIYFSFEQEFDRIKDIADGEDATDVEEWLASLNPQGLSRSPRLRSDLNHLRANSVEEYSVKGSERNTQSVADLLSKCQSNKHLLIAYAWVMYMATFSGGRWIRSQFANAGPDFWLGKYGGSRPKDEESTELPGFSFLSFDGEFDGEDIKKQFKANLGRADDLLTMQQKEEIVTASRELFQYCIDMVHEIDKDVWWQESASWQIPIALLGLGLAWMILRAYSGHLYTSSSI